MTITVERKTPLSNKRMPLPPREVECWIFSYLCDDSTGYLLLNKYVRRTIKGGRRKKGQTLFEYHRNGSDGKIELTAVPIPEDVQQEAKEKLLKRISVVTQI